MAIQRNLDLSKNYSITGSTYISLIDGSGCTCDNCNKLIANMVFIVDENGKNYTVGLDCAKTLTSLNKTELEKHESNIKAINRFHKKFNELIQYGWEVVIFNGKLFTVGRKTYNEKPFFSLRYEGQKINPENLSNKAKQFLTTKDDFVKANPDFENNSYLNYI
jgi:hypothetical protein